MWLENESSPPHGLCVDLVRTWLITWWCSTCHSITWNLPKMALFRLFVSIYTTLLPQDTQYKGVQIQYPMFSMYLISITMRKKGLVSFPCVQIFPLNTESWSCLSILTNRHACLCINNIKDLFHDARTYLFLMTGRMRKKYTHRLSDFNLNSIFHITH